ncbi:hypothetical protein [Frankia sp. KB5]|uniref:hypothetical protein n=1 Tax=Frankia sp. KB5 TaxID=683318 RepID=UPI000A113D5C|nr:hypothetical protein [Frankia sp. KB5]ORT46583.1 hypothetical protein KBI5_24420 [Frankia sp. KB5]
MFPAIAGNTGRASERASERAGTMAGSSSFTAPPHPSGTSRLAPDDIHSLLDVRVGSDDGAAGGGPRGCVDAAAGRGGTAGVVAAVRPVRGRVLTPSTP